MTQLSASTRAQHTALETDILSVCLDQETSRQAVARSLGVKSRRKKPEEDADADDRAQQQQQHQNQQQHQQQHQHHWHQHHQQQQQQGGSSVSPQTQQARTQEERRRASQRVAEMKKKLTRQVRWHLHAIYLAEALPVDHDALDARRGPVWLQLNLNLLAWLNVVGLDRDAELMLQVASVVP